MQLTYIATVRIDGAEFKHEEKAESYQEAVDLVNFWLRGQDGKVRELVRVELA